LGARLLSFLEEQPGLRRPLDRLDLAITDDHLLDAIRHSSSRRASEAASIAAGSANSWAR
jgi:hypothetical protein